MSLPKLKCPLIFRLPTADSGCKQYLNGTARAHFLNLKFGLIFLKVQPVSLRNTLLFVLLILHKSICNTCEDF